MLLGEADRGRREECPLERTVVGVEADKVGLVSYAATRASQIQPFAILSNIISSCLSSGRDSPQEALRSFVDWDSIASFLSLQSTPNHRLRSTLRIDPHSRISEALGHRNQKDRCLTNYWIQTRSRMVLQRVCRTGSDREVVAI